MTAKPKFTGSAVLEKDAAERAKVDQLQAGVQWEWTANEAPYPRVYHIALRRDDEGTAVTAYCVELPGAITEADDDESAEQQLRDVVEAMLEEYGRSGQAVPWVARQAEAGDEVVASITV